MKPQRDYYEVLEVDRTSDARTIKRAFLKKARELHPDVNDAADAEERFKEVNEAYSVLSDDVRRQNYDRYGDPDGPFGSHSGSDYVDMSDFFSGFGMDDLFSSFFGGMNSRPARTRGRDMAMTLTISLEEAASGCSKTIAYERLAPCEDCAGSGSEGGQAAHSCISCAGTGRVSRIQRTIIGQMQTQMPCPDCGGLGQVIDNPCETCNGQGRTPSREKIEIEIPAGIRSGQRLVREGFGEAGIRGEAAGDLVLAIEVEPHDRFVVQGEDLLIHANISAFQAMLGCTLSLDGILEDERLALEVPAGTQQGDRVRLAGAGMPRMGSSKRGDLIATISIEIPRDLSDEERESIEELAAGRDESFGDEAFELEFDRQAEQADSRRSRRVRWPWERA